MAEEMFGPYRVGRLVGRGGMGEVHRAFDTVREREVALKRLHRELAADPDFQVRFRRESRLAARLSSPHVIPIHDFGEYDGRLYIDMRLAEGADVAALLRENGHFVPARAVRVVEQVADALDAAHAAELVHRDVKPSNVLLVSGQNRDFAYLVDFGVVRALDGSGGTSVTGTGAAVGTVAYMAPEVLAGGRGSPASDVYALTCLLHEMLVGDRPFSAPTVAALMYQHVHSDPPRPARKRKDVPAGFDDVVALGMAKDPDRRPGSAGELAALAAEALAGRRPAGGGSAATVPVASSRAPRHAREDEDDSVATAGPDGAPHPVAPPPPVASPSAGTGRSHRRRQLLAGVAVGVSLVAAVVLAVVLTTSRGAPPESAAPAPPLPPGPVSPLALRGQTYTVGGQNFDEQLLLCKITAAALRAHGADVAERCITPGNTATRQALLSGQVDVAWRYTGTGWLTDLGHTEPIKDPLAQYTAVRDADAPNGVTWLPPAPFDNTYAIATTRAFAQQRGLRTMSDWARLVESGDPSATTCVDPQFGSRGEGLPGALRAYGVTRAYSAPPAVATVSFATLYQTLAGGTRCTFGEVFSTDGRLPGLGLVVLADDRNFFPAFNAAPVFRTESLRSRPAAGRVLEDVAQALTYPVMLDLNGQVSSQGRDPDEVARTWLRNQGLIS